MHENVMSPAPWVEIEASAIEEKPTRLIMPLCG